VNGVVPIWTRGGAHVTWWWNTWRAEIVGEGDLRGEYVDTVGDESS